MRNSGFFIDRNKIIDFRQDQLSKDLQRDTIKGLSLDLLESNVLLEKAKGESNKAAAKVVLLLYNEYVHGLYYTPSNITPFLEPL